MATVTVSQLPKFLAKLGKWFNIHGYTITDTPAAMPEVPKAYVPIWKRFNWFGYGVTK